MRLSWVSRCWRAASAQTLNQIIVVFEFSSLASCIKISDSFRQKIINFIIFECVFSKKIVFSYFFNRYLDWFAWLRVFFFFLMKYITGTIFFLFLPTLYLH
jgi:hypothetical protein